MNTTTGSGTFVGSYDVGAVSYGIGVSIGILLLITTVTIAAYFCFRTASTTSSNFVPQGARPRGAHDIVLEVGIEDEIIKTYPRFLYSQVKTKGGSLASNSTCCSICLADYKGSDMLRMLPDCGHVFHVKCIDPWLRLHPTCPVCRNSPLPTPLSTPLAEVVPLASRRD